MSAYLSEIWSQQGSIIASKYTDIIDESWFTF